MDNEQRPIDNRRIMFSAQRTKSPVIHRAFASATVIFSRYAKKTLVAPAAVIVVISIVLGFNYLADQQMLRLGGNDPQVQIATDAAAALGRGAVPSSVAASVGREVDLAESLSPFIMVFDAQGRVVASSGILNGWPPKLPQGVLNYAKAHGEDRLTWQPASGIRIAAVVETIKGRSSGYVLAGRSLKEVEKREDLLFWQFAIAWILSIGAIIGAWVLYGKARP